MTLTLAIETSNPSSSPEGEPPCEAVALGESSHSGSARVIASEPLRRQGRHDDALLPAIDRLCRGAGVGPSDLDRVAVSIGPGGYTAVRLAVTAASAIAESTRSTLIGVPTACVAAHDAPAWNGRLGVALASKHGSACVRVFRTPRDSDPGALLNESQLAELDLTLLLADRHLPDAWRHEAERLGLPIAPLRLSPEACFHASLGTDCTAGGMGTSEPGRLLPIYPREPEAVRLWRERHGPAK